MGDHEFGNLQPPEDLSSLEQLAEELGMTEEELIETIQEAAGEPTPRPDIVDDDFPVPRPEPFETVESGLTPEAREAWGQAREIAAGLPGLMPPGPIEGGFLGNPPLDERYPDADRILGQGMLD